MMNGKIIEWGELEDGADDCFQDSLDRLSSAVSVHLPSSASEDEGYCDGRLSFVSAVATPSRESNVGDVDRGFENGFGSFDAVEMSEFQMWMADPRSVGERRRKLLQGMGLFGSGKLIRLNSSEMVRSPAIVNDETSAVEKVDKDGFEHDHPRPDPTVTSPNGKLVRSKSAMARFEGGLDQGKIETLGQFSRLPVVCRYASAPSCLYSGCVENRDLQFSKGSSSAEADYRCDRDQTLSSPQDFCKIKNLDTGKEFVVNELKEDGTWNYLSDMDTGEQLTMEEFERCVGYSPIVKELMRRENFVSDAIDDADKLESTALKSKSLLSNAKKKAAWLKNIKGVANSVSGLIGDKERDSSTSYINQSNQQSPWTRVRQHGKSYKELTGLYMSQEIQAHEGSIWSMRFSLDGRYLASAGADKVIHIWQVLECETILSVPEDAHFNLLRSIASHQCDRFSHMEHLSIKKNKKGKIASSSSKCSFQDYVVVPKTIFSLSEKPMCSLQGHLDDVLDLSWSKSQRLLSSSMDKTVRLWDLESKTCLKLFAHNDYVTCIQFNPVDERYFISGSLDAKVRIWSIPDHKVVDWSDFHEMVTAACYTPDGQGALVGSHKGTCRLYDTSGCKLSQNGQIDIYKKKQKGRAKKITGFQFSPLNPSEVMITSADSQIRVFEGTDRIQKFRGFQNTSSQIAASFTPDGKYVVCASEDSQVYVWKHDDLQTVSINIVSGNGGKSKDHRTTRSHEHFLCRDVSVAIPWPGVVKYESPYFAMRSRGYKNQSFSSRQSSNQQPESLEDAFTSSRSYLPPLPENDNDQLTNIPEDFANLSSCMHSDASGNMSFDSTMSSRFDGFYNNAREESLSSSTSSLLSSRWLFNGNHTSSSSINTSTAWGLTLVTAGLGGEIRVYHNFGLPLRLQNQSFSLFGGLRQEAHAT